QPPEVVSRKIQVLQQQASGAREGPVPPKGKKHSQKEDKNEDKMTLSDKLKEATPAECAEISSHAGRHLRI
ncbi:hypothetical protein J0S82_019050, partial [Galemys pyrenaicus]